MENKNYNDEDEDDYFDLEEMINKEKNDLEENKLSHEAETAMEEDRRAEMSSYLEDIASEIRASNEQQMEAMEKMEEALKLLRETRKGDRGESGREGRLGMAGPRGERGETGKMMTYEDIASMVERMSIDYKNIKNTPNFDSLLNRIAALESRK